MVYWTHSHLEPCWILCHVHSYVWCKSLGPECLPASKAGIISIWNRQADLKFMANWVPLLALWPTMRCRRLCAKLSFLHKIHSRESSTLSTEVFNTLTFPNVESTLLIKHCHFLEQPSLQNFTDEVLTNPEICMRSLKEQIFTPTEWGKGPSIPSIVAEIANSLSWLKVWDTALDNRPNGTVTMLPILKLLCKNSLCI